MGEVYLAHDTTLDRNVALKLLPSELAARSDRMRRFVLEAKAAAALKPSKHRSRLQYEDLVYIVLRSQIHVPFTKGVCIRCIL